MFKTIIASVCLALGALSSACLADSANSANSANSVTLAAFGGKPGLVKLMDDFMPRLLADSRMGPFFKDANHQRVKEQLVDQFCFVLDGPCKYEGADMKSSHATMDIRKGDFNALVEVLQQSMNAQGIAFSAQNGLLSKLAPMHRDIITIK